MGVALKINKLRIDYDAPSVPIGPADGNIPLSMLDPSLQKLVERMKEYMVKRPIWTSRALEDQFTIKEGMKFVKLVYQYVGYMFASGPWRDAIITFGVDPRSDPKYRVYQTLMFQYVTEPMQDTKPKPKDREKKKQKPGFRTIWTDRTSHIFDGVNIPAEGRVFQICDITDPLIKSILATTNIRETCHVSKHSPGWWRRLDRLIDTR
jgi:general transcription factor 3C polypeptide 5 (transcription factor C subunit 1)